MPKKEIEKPLVFGLFPSRRRSAAPKPLPNPDFTKGDKLPESAVHDWTLGATGARGWMYNIGSTPHWPARFTSPMSRRFAGQMVC